MCGRLNIIHDLLSQEVHDFLGIRFSTTTNTDLRPTQNIDSIVLKDNQVQQCGLSWGIKPEWSQKLLINAQAETVATRKTFSQAFSQRRCLIPCSGWYEWSSTTGKKKQKYLFDSAHEKVLYMGGIYFTDPQPQVVSLTISANKQCSKYHHRMPLLIEPDDIQRWLYAHERDLGPLMFPPVDHSIRAILSR